MPGAKEAKKSLDILLVEDCGMFVKVFQRIFDQSTYSVEVVKNGAAAWELLQARQPKVLLLDWNLPGMDGPVICQKLRQLKTRNYVYVILVTTNSQLRHKVTGFEAGADDYLVKPYEPAVLMAKVKVGLRIWELEQSIAHKVEELAEANARQQDLIQDLQEKNRAISQRTAELHAAQQQLVEVARRAGMAEIATSVLHNVGNLLNTAITSSMVLKEVTEHSRGVTLSRLADLVEAKGAGFADYVAQHPPGQKFPEFFVQLAKALSTERNTAQAKLQSLGESLEQIREIIGLQQGYAGLAGVKEHVAAQALLEDAAKLFSDSFKRHDINLRFECAPEVPELKVERHKVLQILVNLLRNARDATKLVPREARAIGVRVSLAGEGRVTFRVSDNGEGIDPKNLPRIFNFGFTTKANGHGFGLHSCANLAKEMGGTLKGVSAGKGLGAEFILELPLS